MTRRVIPLASAVLMLAACTQSVWEADKIRYPTRAQQEAAFERQSERCQMRSRVISTSSQTMTDTQTYRPGHRVEHDRALFRACMEDAGFTLSGSDRTKTPPVPEKTAGKPENISMNKELAADKNVPAKPPVAEVPAPLPPPPPQTMAIPPQPAPAAGKLPPAASMTAANTPFRIQLGSYRTRAVAEKEWTRLQTVLPEFFASGDPIIAKATLPGRGTFYRLQSGGFDTMQEARSMCATLRTKKQACFPLRKS